MGYSTVNYGLNQHNLRIESNKIQNKYEIEVLDNDIQ